LHFLFSGIFLFDLPEVIDFLFSQEIVNSSKVFFNPVMAEFINFIDDAVKKVAVM